MEAAHTVSQRLRQLKKIPAELIPLGTSTYVMGCILLERAGRRGDA